MRFRRNTFSTIIFSIVVLLFTNSCVVNKPDLYGISSKDYNTRRKVNGAHYTKRLSVPGIILTAAAPVAGAVAGYNVNLISIQKGEKTVPVKPANAAIGAIAGYSLANFINYCMGLNKQSPAPDPAKWTKNINNHYAYVPNSIEGEGKFTIIEKAAERNYKVKNLEDTKQFYATFPSSSYKNPVFQQSIKICNRSQLLELLALDQNNQYANDAKRKYIEESLTYEELASANSKYPEINYNYEERYASLVSSPSHAIDFHRRYPNSALTKKVIWNAFTASIPSKTDINSMSQAFKGDFEMTQEDLKHNPTDSQKSNFMKAQFLSSNIKNETDLEFFYRKYDWLNYGNKTSDIADNVLNIAYNSYNESDYIIYYMNQLPNNTLYKKWGVSNAIVKESIKKKMKEEASKVSIVTTNTIGTDNSDWQKWMRNWTYTAGIVAETGKVQYLVYGEIQNNSKLDLPVVITASADLKSQGGLKGKRFQMIVEERLLASATCTFVIPSMEAKTKSSYALLLDFGKNGNSGLNIGDIAKIVSECFLSNLKVSFAIEEKNVSSKTVEQQESWMHLAQNGMPEIPLTDLKRKERVDEEVWAQRWEVERQLRAEAWERAKTRKANEEAYKSMINANNIMNYVKDISFKKELESRTEYDVTFTDGRTGKIAYIKEEGVFLPTDVKRWAYYSPGIISGAYIYADREGFPNTQSGAIAALYHYLHKQY